jgi:hypothetical protein
VCVALGLPTPDAATAKAQNGLIAYTASTGEGAPSAIWTINPDGSGNQLLLGADAPGQAGVSEPRWSHDGKWLLLVRTPGGGDRSLWYMTASGQHMRRIPLPGFGELGGYDWAPDSRQIVVSMVNYRGEVLRSSMLYTQRVNGTHRKKLRAGLDPSWAGRHIAFTLRRPRRGSRRHPYVSTVNVVHPVGTGYKCLSPPRFNDDWFASISPGGSKIVFQHGFFDEGHGKWGMVDVTGKNYRLWPDPNIVDPHVVYANPHWTPAGTRLFTVRASYLPGASKVELVTFNRAGKDQRVQFAFPENVGFGTALAWQPVPEG